MHLDLRVGPKAKRVLVNIFEIKEIHKEIAKQIKNRNERVVTHNNKKRKNRP